MAIQCAVGDIHLLSAAASNFTTSQQPFSISLWINGTWNGGAALSFVGIYGPSPSPTTALQIGTKGAGLVDCWTWGGANIVSSASTMTNGAWIHIVYTYDSTTHRLYINGALSNTATTAQLAGQFTTVYINGHPTGAASETSNHQVDSCAYYDRTLSADEVITMFNSRGTHGIVYGLLASYEFDERAQGAASVSVTDLSGNGNTLTSSGGGASPITHTYSGAVVSSNIRRVH